MTKTKEMVKTEPKNALQLLAYRLKVSPKSLEDTLKKTAFRECANNNAAFLSAVVVANTYQLNPILKEVTAFPGKHGGVIPIVMIDGWVSMTNRQEQFDGVELIENAGDNDGGSGCGIESVTAKFYLKNKSHPVVITEYMAECYNGNKEPWKKWPRRMLRHKAYIQGARIAFGFSGVYDPDEAERIEEATLASEEQDLTVESKTPMYDEQPSDNENAKPNAYKAMLEEFKKQRDRIGDEKYYAIMGNNGYERANQIPKIAEGNKILTEMEKVEVREPGQEG